MADTAPAAAAEAGEEARGSRVNVKNLCQSTTADELKSFFACCGTVTDVEVKVHPDGSSKGYGFVCFSTPEEADKAVSEMNGKTLEENKLVVKIAERRYTEGKGEPGKDKSKGKGKQKAQLGYMDPYAMYGAGQVMDPMVAAMGYPYYDASSMMNPYGYDLGAIYNAMYGTQGMPCMPQMYSGFPMGAMPGMPMPRAGKEPAAVDPNAILALQQAQAFALQSQAMEAARDHKAGGANKDDKGKGKGAQSKGKGKAGKAKASQENTGPMPEAPPPDQEFVGYLKSKSEKNGYGFIVCGEIQERYQRDVWVDSELLPEGVDTDSRAELKFNVTLSTKGHPQAKNVVLA